MKVQKITPALGAEISGVDFSGNFTSEFTDKIYDLLMEHQVIFFRDQDISPAAHFEFAKSFGTLTDKHPLYPSVEDFDQIMLLQNDGDNPPDTDGWHTDMTFKQNPPFATILIAREIPDFGGDTLWMSLYAAYEALPLHMKDLLEDKYAVHDFGDFRNSYVTDDDYEAASKRIADAHQKFGSAIHKIVQVHPITKRKFLFVNESFTQHIVGMRAFESNDLLHYLHRHMMGPEFQMRFKWTKGALAMWDNRVTQHYATNDYMPNFRSMNRITVINDRRAG